MKAEHVILLPLAPVTDLPGKAAGHKDLVPRIVREHLTPGRLAGTLSLAGRQ